MANFFQGYAFYDFVYNKGENECQSFLLGLPESLRDTYTLDQQWTKRTLAFITDTLYASAGQAVVMRDPSVKAFSYLWAYPNHILASQSPELSGIAIHCTEMIYTSGLYLDELPKREADLSREMAKRWISFACGIDPWKPGEPMEYDFNITEHGELRVALYTDSTYRRLKAQEIIARDIDKYGALLREFLY
jgi:carboxylesterase type B